MLGSGAAVAAAYLVLLGQVEDARHEGVLGGPVNVRAPFQDGRDGEARRRGDLRLVACGRGGAGERGGGGNGGGNGEKHSRLSAAMRLDEVSLRSSSMAANRSVLAVHRRITLSSLLAALNSRMSCAGA